MDGRHLHAAIAAIFLYAPSLASRISGRPFDYRDAGLRLDPLGLNLRVLAVALAMTFPLFVVGFFVFYGFVCGPHGGPLTALWSGLCSYWRGLHGGSLRLPPEFLTSALNQLIVVAMPEELFVWATSWADSTSGGPRSGACWARQSDVVWSCRACCSRSATWRSSPIRSG